jgi:hypothetical protein
LATTSKPSVFEGLGVLEARTRTAAATFGVDMVMLEAAVVIVNEEGLMEAWWRCRCVGVGVGVGVAVAGGGGLLAF